MSEEPTAESLPVVYKEDHEEQTLQEQKWQT